jgi:hypothetical protein
MSPTEIVLTVGSITTAITVITAALMRLMKFTQRVDKAIGADANGLTAIDRLEAKVGDIGHRVERVEYQLHPNGGGSLADRVRVMDITVGKVEAQTELMVGLVQTLVDGHGRTGAATIPGDPVAAPETEVRLRPTNRKPRTRKE